MLYKDDKDMPRTFGEYEKRCRADVRMTGDDARAVLAKAGVRGRSKMSAAQALEIAEAEHAELWRAARDAKTVWWRWIAAHGLRLSYGELERVERACGVVPDMAQGARGAYESAEDARKVYDGAARAKAEAHTVKVRVSYADAADREAARQVVDALDAAFECSTPAVYDDREGFGARLYFEVSVQR